MLNALLLSYIINKQTNGKSSNTQRRQQHNNEETRAPNNALCDVDKTADTRKSDARPAKSEIKAEMRVSNNWSVHHTSNVAGIGSSPVMRCITPLFLGRDRYWWLRFLPPEPVLVLPVLFVSAAVVCCLLAAIGVVSEIVSAAATAAPAGGFEGVFESVAADGRIELSTLCCR